MGEKAITVIIPVYNAEKYIVQCMESISNQTFFDIEILCIDDGSTDGSSKILDELASRDERIRVIHKRNAGLVAARKTGVEFSTGQYIAFVDADDWVDGDMMEQLYDYAKTYDCDMVCSGIIRQFEDYAVLNKNTIKEGLYEKADLIKCIYPYMLCDGHFFQLGVRPNLVGKLIRKNILQEIQTDAPEDVTNGEDVMITYPSLLKCNKVYLLDQAWYHYRQHPASMSQKKAGEKEKDAMKHLYSFLERHFEKEVFNLVLMKQLRYYFAHLLIQREPEVFDDYLGELRIFGKTEIDDTLVIYGAGRFGKQIYQYATENGRKVIWVDKKAAVYQRQGLPVEEVSVLRTAQYDRILIAVIDEEMAKDICNELVIFGVTSNKMRCLDLAYITSVL